MILRFGILTSSDRCSRGERPDLSGPALAELVIANGWKVACTTIVADDLDVLRETFATWADGGELDIILTTGGTGFSPRDVTPDATREVIERELPGMAEAMRRQSMTVTPHAMISRALVGIRGRTLIINLPGSPKGARENLNVLLPALTHAIEKIKGDQSECAS